MTTNLDINNLMDEIKKEKLEDIAPAFKENLISKKQIEQIIKVLENKFVQLPPRHILAAMILLFLKGAATRTTPPTMGVEIDGITITKADLENATNMVLNNKYIRRVAEAIATEIGIYAELNGLDGELAGRIDKIISENNYMAQTNEPPLTAKERAWCSSFSQGIRDLDKRSSERLVKWLNVDYNTRFNKRIKAK